MEQAGRGAIALGDAVDPLRVGGKMIGKAGSVAAGKVGSTAVGKAGAAMAGEVGRAVAEKVKSTAAARIGPEKLAALKNALGGPAEIVLGIIAPHVPRAVPAGRLAIGVGTSARSTTSDVKNK